MNRPVIRVGDKTSHGGEVLAGSPNFIVEGKEVQDATLVASQAVYFIE
jgi:uncharacterized Zn-binding protein involved in type VI secretion